MNDNIADEGYGMSAERREKTNWKENEV